MKLILAIATALVLTVAQGQAASAADKLRVGKAIQNAFTFALLDVGVANGVFKGEGLEVEPVTFAGSLKLQQAMAANAIDLGLSTGQDIGYIAKGLPVTTVAAISNAPRETVMLVAYNSPIKTIAELKGKTVAVSNLKGYPAWLTVEFSKNEGWGPHGVKLVATGSQQTSMALLRTGQVDAWAGDIGTGFELEDAHRARAVANLGEHVPPFMNLALYATDKLVESRPDLVRRFVKAWFDNIAWARNHREKTIALLAPALNLKPSVIGRVYDKLMPVQSRDGKFDPKAMATVRRAVVELGILDKEQDLSKFRTEKFLPKS